MHEPVYLKAPVPGAPAAASAGVAERVSEMLLAIEQRGLDAVRAYSRELDNWDPPSFEVLADDIDRATAELSEELKASIAFAQAQIGHFAELQRATLTAFE